MNYKALYPVLLLTTLAGCTLDEPVNYDIMCGGKLGIAAINDKGTLHKPDDAKCNASGSQCKEYEKAFESSICPKGFNCVPEVRICVNIECDEGTHYTLEGCKPDTLTECGSSATDCTQITGWSDGYCAGGKCYATACGTGYELAAEQCIARTNCPADYHLFAGNCEEDNIHQCGTHTNDCESIAGWAGGACRQSKCMATSCQNGYELNLETSQCEARTNCPEGSHFFDGNCEPDDINNCGQHKTVCSADHIAGWLTGDCIGGKCVATSCSSGYGAENGICKAEKDCGDDKHYSPNAVESDFCVDDTPENCGFDGNNCLQKQAWTDAICYGGHCVATACKDNAKLSNHDCEINPECVDSCNLNTLTTCVKGEVTSYECKPGYHCTTQDGVTGCYEATPCGNYPHGTTKCNEGCNGVLICNNGNWEAYKACDSGQTCSRSVCGVHEFNYTSIKEIKDDYDDIVACPMAKRAYDINGVVTFGDPLTGFYVQDDNTVNKANQRGIYVKQPTNEVKSYNYVNIKGTKINVSNGQLQLAGNDLSIAVDESVQKSASDLDVPLVTEEEFINGGTNGPFLDRMITLHNAAIKRGSIDLDNCFQVTTEGNVEGFTLEACLSIFYNRFKKNGSMTDFNNLVNSINGAHFYGCLGTGKNYTLKIIEKVDFFNLSNFDTTDAVMEIRKIFVRQINTFTFDIFGVAFFNKDYSIYVSHTDYLQPIGCLDSSLEFDSFDVACY